MMLDVQVVAVVVVVANRVEYNGNDSVKTDDTSQRDSSRKVIITILLSVPKCMFSNRDGKRGLLVSPLLRYSADGFFRV